MARDSFPKTAAPLVVLTFVGVYNFPPITQEEMAARDADGIACELYHGK